MKTTLDCMALVGSAKTSVGQLPSGKWVARMPLDGSGDLSLVGTDVDLVALADAIYAAIRPTRVEFAGPITEEEFQEMYPGRDYHKFMTKDKEYS